jgi:superfamily I DNA/RNA helicase
MPITIPENPVFKSDAEFEVWKALKEQLPEKAYLLQNVKLCKGGTDYEVDTIVAWPGQGIVFIEVKGGLIQLNDEGQWTTRNRHGDTKLIDPADQVQTVMFAMRDYVKERWSHGGLKTPWLVVFPETNLPANTSTPSLPANRMVDKAELKNIAEYIKEVAKDASYRQYATADTCKSFADLLMGRRDQKREFILSSRDRTREIKRLTDEQSEVLDLFSESKQFLVKGPAGTGKTFLALEQTKRLCAGGLKIALICYSNGLAQYLKREVSAWPTNEQPKFVGTFHSLANSWGVRKPAEMEDDVFWESGAAKEAIKILQSRTNLERYDGFVIDEAQDFNEDWWNVLPLAYSNDVEENILCVFGDSAQKLFDREGMKSLNLPPMTVTKNMRNCIPIADFSTKFSKEKMISRGLPGLPIEFYPCERAFAHERADEIVTVLLEEGWQPKDILVITTNHRHREQREKLKEHNFKKKLVWEDFFERDEVFYSHVSAIKGLERPVVVVAVDGWKNIDLKDEYTYVALTRARDLLIMCGEVDELEKII